MVGDAARLLAGCPNGADGSIPSRSARRENARMGTKARARKMAAVIERDSAICWICGNAVDLAIRDNSGPAPSLDHVIPMRDGGTHALDNLRLAHVVCNLKRERR